MRTNEQQVLLQQELATISRFCNRVRLARATELARSERWLEAEALLLQDHKVTTTAAELDLLARIAARQGRFRTARQRWETALNLQPENDAYRACLEALTPTRKIRLWWPRLQNLLLGVFVSVGLLIGVWVLLAVFVFNESKAF